MDGNMARRILRDHPDLLAEECNVPLDLVKGVYVIWIALASRLPICPEKFKAFCDNVHNIYLENCAWYRMSPTLHKVLVHGYQVMMLFPDSVTSGMLSEEPAEASNKDVKKFQKEHAPQNCPIARNLAVFNRINDRSDPQVLHHFAKKSKNQRKSQEIFPKAVLDMCKDSTQIAAELSL